MSFLSPSTPGLGPVPQNFFRSTLQSQSPTLPGQQGQRLSQLFGNMLQSGADPSEIAFAANTISQMYPGERDFSPGGIVGREIFKSQFKPQTRKEAKETADRMTMSFLGRGLTDEERRYVGSEKPSESEWGQYLTSSPEFMLAQYPSGPEEARMAAYYGPQIPTRSETGSIMYTGLRRGFRNPFD